VGEVISLKAVKKKKQQGGTLCREGHHKWVINQEKQFDSRSGKLVTLSVCSRCGKKKTQLL